MTELDGAYEVLARAAAEAPDRPGRVVVQREAGHIRLRLDNPSARNAMTVAMMAQLAEAVASLQDASEGLLILEATGEVFCAGGHLAEVLASLDEGSRYLEVSRAMRTVLDGLLRLPMVSVCVLNGAAIGGGAELCTSTDLRLAQAGTQIHFVHASLEIVPQWGGAARLQHHVGPRAALRVLAQARPLDAAEACAMGLVDATGVDGEELLQALLARDPVTLRALKLLLAAERTGDRDAADAAASGVWGSPAHRARLGGLLRHGD